MRPHVLSLSSLAIALATAALGCSAPARAHVEDEPVEHGVRVNMGDPPVPEAPRVDEIAFHPTVRLTGRFDTRDPGGPRCAWPACSATAVFEGNTARVWLYEETEAWMTGGPSEWDVLVDGAWTWKLAAEPGAHDYTLVSGIHWGVHSVELSRRSEARYGTTQILGFDFHVGVLLGAAPPRARRIEVIGDAASAGFGIEGVGRGEGCPGGADQAAWQNIRRAYPQRLADLLDAELDAVVASGVGVARNQWRPELATFSVLEERALPFDPSSTFAFDARAPDAIVAMIGEADFAAAPPSDGGALSTDEFHAAYRDLLERLRARAPAAKIFLVTSPTASDEVPAGRRTRSAIAETISALVAERRDRADLWTYAATPGRAPPEELTACDGHGNASLHERIAQELATIVRAKLAWR